MVPFGFSRTPLIDEPSRDWLLDAFAWALRNADTEVFFQQTQLILPTPEFFPERSHSAAEMATHALNRVKRYAHMEQWPFQLVDPNQLQSAVTVEPILEGRLRNNIATGHVATKTSPAQHLPALPLTCISQQLNNPEALIGTFAQGVSYYLNTQIKELPPGGQDFLPQAIDLLATFLGFGVMLVNSAYTFKGGCGSCYNPLSNRNAALTETDTLYALAIFCELKGLPSSSAKPHLKKHLRSGFVRACKEIKKEGYADRLSH